MTALTVLSLFSGIGGLDLAAEMAGMQVVAQCETDEYCRRVLAKHWPHVRCYGDVRALTATRLRTDGVRAPVCIIGGFPCQDISGAGHRLGLRGERSGLWREYARLIGELQPRYVVVENVAALLHRGMGSVLGDLATLGYDAEWSVVSACAVGAPHTRERLFIVAYPNDVHGQKGMGLVAHRAFAHERGHNGTRPRGWLEPFAGVRGMADGLSLRLDRLRGLGNAVVLAQALPVFEAIMQAEREAVS